MKISKNISIGVVVVSAITILILGVNFLKGNSLFTSQDIYFAKYSRVDGLKNSSPVTLRGLRVGQVNSIRLAADNKSLLVQFTIDSNIQLPVGTIVNIVSSDIMGSKELQLNLSCNSQNLQSGDTLQGKLTYDLKEELSMQILPLKQKAEKLITNIDSVFTAIQYIFNKENQEHLKNSISNINTILSQLENTSSAIHRIVTAQENHIAQTIVNVDSITGNLKNNGKNITHILNKFAAISDSLKSNDVIETVKYFKSTLQNINNILHKIDNNNGSLGNLLNDDSLYTNLSNTSESLNQLLIDVKKNPKRYIHFSLFGKKSQLSKADEKDLYAIQVLSSPEKIAPNSPVFKIFKKVDVVFLDGEYRYLVLKNSNRKKVIRQLRKIQKKYPQSIVVKITETNIKQ